MIRPWRRYLLALLVFYLVALLATVPASVCWRLAAGKLPAVQVSGLQGSLWHGQVERLMITGKRIEGLAWELNGWPLWLATLGLDWRLTGAQIKGHGALSVSLFGSEKRVTAESLTMPLSELAQLIQLPFGRLQGMLTLELEELSTAKGEWRQVQGRIKVQNAALAGQSPLAFGDINIVVKTTERGIEAALQDTGGPLVLDGVFTMNVRGDYRFSGKLAARDQASPALRQSLSMLGTAGPDGRIQVNDVGRWPAL